MSSGTMQAATQYAPTQIPVEPYVVNTSSSAHRQYQQQSGQYERLSPDTAVTNATNFHQSSQQTSRRPSGSTQPSNPYISQNTQHQSPTGSHPSSNSTPRGQATTSTSRSPSQVILPTASVSQQPSRRDQQNQLEGPPIPPPPRSSSNQRGQNFSNASSVLADRTVTSNLASRPIDDGPSSHRRNENGGRERTTYQGESTSFGEPSQGRDDLATTAAAAARSRRRDHISPEPHYGAGAQDPRVSQNPSANKARTVPSTNASVPPPKISREGSEIINRVVITDPQIDLVREQERLREAVPEVPGADEALAGGLSLVGDEGVDDGGRGGGRSRQDHSSTASRRKETKFGEYILGQTLGEGEFGKVKLGWKKDGSVQVAIKLIRRESLGTNPSRLPKIYREISILRELQHPNIVRLHEMVETDRHIGIILEYASGGELFDFILNHRYLKDHAARRLFAQLVSGVGYLHKKGIVHRDLKLENLLLDRNRNIIITDFGFANTFNPWDELTEEIEYNLTNREYVKRMNLERVQENGSRKGDLMQTSCGSPCYAAPELVVTDSLYTGRKVDVWSCGVILYAMLAGYLPFDDDPANPEGDNINLLYKYIVSTPLTFPEYVTPHARDLLRRILVPDPRKRADLFEVARHSWLSEYAQLVSQVTSSTTTVGDISRPATAPDEHQEPQLARSASVREPTRTYPTNVSPVGGLSHQGKIESSENPKPQRDAKRRTVQVEYVAPSSQTVRGNVSISANAPAVAGSSPVNSRSRTRAGAQGPVEAPRPSGSNTSSKPLPQEPSVASDSTQQQTYQTPNRTQQRPANLQQGMLPPARPSREVPRSVSDSTSAFGQGNVSARPHTSGTITSGRLPSRGNSYSQPLAPTLAATNAQGRLAQPEGRTYISAPIPQQDPNNPGSSYNPSSNQPPHSSHGHKTALTQSNHSKGHKRSSTLGSVFGRASLFGGRPQVQPPQEPPRQRGDKRYPPTSMKNPMSSDSPRQSMDSRRSSSFGFKRKESDTEKTEKSRRFSLLPASFSLKSLTGSAKDQTLDDSRLSSQQQQRQPEPLADPALNRPQSKHPGMAFGRGQSRSNSFSTEDSVQVVYDGQRDRTKQASVPQPKRIPGAPHSVPQPIAPLESRFNSTQPLPMEDEELAPPKILPNPGQSYLLPESGPGTPSERSQKRRPQYPTGFNSYEAEHRTSAQPTHGGRGPNVLSKNNRRFADAYEQGQDSGGRAGGHNAGSSGPARKVMDFFRRRGKARSGDDR